MHVAQSHPFCSSATPRHLGARRVRGPKSWNVLGAPLVHIMGSRSSPLALVQCFLDNPTPTHPFVGRKFLGPHANLGLPPWGSAPLPHCSSAVGSAHPRTSQVEQEPNPDPWPASQALHLVSGYRSPSGPDSAAFISSTSSPRMIDDGGNHEVPRVPSWEAHLENYSSVNELHG